MTSSLPPNIMKEDLDKQRAWLVLIINSANYYDQEFTLIL